MAWTAKQKGVVRSAIPAAAISVSLIVLGVLLDPFSLAGDGSIEARLRVAALGLVAPALFLLASIGRLANHRFFSEEDIDGSGLAEGTKKARLLQALLQNTLEQAVLAGLVYPAWSLLMPSSWLSVVPLAALSFALGRVLFFRRYEGGAPGRALGFALTFYPSAMMLACLLARLAVLPFL